MGDKKYEVMKILTCENKTNQESTWAKTECPLNLLESRRKIWLHFVKPLDSTPKSCDSSFIFDLSAKFFFKN